MKTVVLGVTPNPGRYANIAVRQLLQHKHEVIPIGRKTGEVAGLKIINNYPEIKDVDTVTLYLNPENQLAVQDYILGLHPRRIIFNPGTENALLEKAARSEGIQTVHGCTLIMLSSGMY